MEILKIQQNSYDYTLFDLHTAAKKLQSKSRGIWKFESVYKSALMQYHSALSKIANRHSCVLYLCNLISFQCSYKV